jgi:hypothetical protein
MTDRQRLGKLQVHETAVALPIPTLNFNAAFINSVTIAKKMNIRNNTMFGIEVAGILCGAQLARVQLTWGAFGLGTNAGAQMARAHKTWNRKF